MPKKKKKHCPCGSGKSYHQCCGHYLEVGALPQTPEQLMRSRFTAYNMKNDAYLLDSWHSSTRPISVSAENELPVKWVDLKIVDAPSVTPDDTTAIVEFIARFKVNGKAEQMHECSEFIKEGGRWFYLKGKVE